MEIRKIAYEEATKENYINIPDEEILALHNKILDKYEKFLKNFGVKPLWKEKPTVDGNGKAITYTDEEIIQSLDAKELQLIFLLKYKGSMVHKDLISAFIRKRIPTAGMDQQVRHLATQYHWNVLNKNSKIPDEDIIIPSGYHYLVSIETPNPKVMEAALKRAGRLAAKSFDDLKITYGRKCATCGIEDGKKDARMNVMVELQQGHMNPNEKLTLQNTIPQCQYCNQTYKNHFIFNEYGRIIAVNNPEFLLQSTEKVQDEMLALLLRVRKKK